MLKKLLPVIIILLMVGAAVGGYCARPFVDLRLVDYPIIQSMALKGVIMYEYVAEMLADYPIYREDVELVALEYGDIMTKIEDAKLREIACCDWRYLAAGAIENEFPIVRVINIKEEDKICTIELYFVDDWEQTRSMESLEARLEISAKGVQLMGEQYPDHFLRVVWAKVQPYDCLSVQCVRATVSVAIDALAEHFVAWASFPKGELFGELERLVIEGRGQIYIDSIYTPWIYIEEELPRLSDDPAPWDQEYFFEE